MSNGKMKSPELDDSIQDFRSSESCITQVPLKLGQSGTEKKQVSGGTFKWLECEEACDAARRVAALNKADEEGRKKST
jgi:hypothetical protein